MDDIRETLIEKAQHQLYIMQDYTHEFDFVDHPGEQSLQVKHNLNFLHIDTNQIDNNFYIKITNDLKALYKIRDLLWFKSFTYNSEIIRVLQKIDLLILHTKRVFDYFKKHEDFIHCHQILNNFKILPPVYFSQDEHELINFIRTHLEKDSSYPLVSFVDAITMEIKFIDSFLSKNNSVERYPEVITDIKLYKDCVLQQLNMISSMNIFLCEFIEKLKNDILNLEKKIISLKNKISSLECQNMNNVMNNMMK